MLVLSALVLLPVPVFATPSISISSPAADGTFILRGEQMAEVAGLDIRIGYDAGKLGNPRVRTGSLVAGMMSASNTGNPVRLAIMGARPVSGSGVIATISFDRTGASPGAVTALTGSLFDANGKRVAMLQPTISNPADIASDAGLQQEPATPVATASNAATARPFMVGGTLSLPQPEERPGETRSAVAPQTAPPEEPRYRKEPPAPVPVPDQIDVPAKAPVQPVTAPRQLPSVLERFRQFQGERTVAKLCALFAREAAERFRQLPPIAVADGKKTVTLIIEMETGDRAPNFALDSCDFVSLQRTAEGRWCIEVRPERGAVQACVTMLYDGLIQEIPLTVTPLAEVTAGNTGGVSEADFRLFLKERGTPSAPRFDMNKDGRRDYLDDYIFTANYLVRSQAQAKKRSGAK